MRLKGESSEHRRAQTYVPKKEVKTLVEERAEVVTTGSETPTTEKRLLWVNFSDGPTCCKKKGSMIRCWGSPGGGLGGASPQNANTAFQSGAINSTDTKTRRKKEALGRTHYTNDKLGKSHTITNLRRRRAEAGLLVHQPINSKKSRGRVRGRPTSLIATSDRTVPQAMRTDPASQIGPQSQELRTPPRSKLQRRGTAVIMG